MKKIQSERIDNIVKFGGVKLHLFQPSGRAIWTVIGKDREHWLDPELEFCSCKNYYFHALSNAGPCYHLKSITQAKSENKFVSIEFDDSEYMGFFKAIISDNANKLLSD
jgi:predicted nucleic acid-binding Zn finger protein